MRRTACSVSGLSREGPTTGHAHVGERSAGQSHDRRDKPQRTLQSEAVLLGGQAGTPARFRTAAISSSGSAGLAPALEASSGT
jgi:hypothetical protein